MLDTVIDLHYNDFMRSYIRIQARAGVPQAVQLVDEGIVYRPVIEHATLDHVHAAENIKKRHGHAHDVYHLVLYTNGRNVCRYRGERVPVRPGTLFLTSPGESHDFFPSRSGEIRYTEATFAYLGPNGMPLRLPFARLLALYAGLDLEAKPLPLMLAGEQVTELREHCKRLLDWLSTPGPLAPLYTLQELGAIFAFLVRECLQSAPSPAGAAGRLHEARAYLEHHFAERLRVEELAARAHLSKGYFLRAFKQAYGLPPIAYQQRLRMEAARTLLRTTGLRCKEIAARVGYDDVYLFSRLFKKVIGQPPTACRRASRA